MNIAATMPVYDEDGYYIIKGVYLDYEYGCKIDIPIDVRNKKAYNSHSNKFIDIKKISIRLKSWFPLKAGISVIELEHGVRIRSRIDYSKVSYNEYEIVKISAEEYEASLKNTTCGCAVGDGHDIKRALMPYNSLEELRKKYGDTYDIDYFKDGDGNTFGTTIVISLKASPDKSCAFDFRLPQVYKKACLACGTCLDELPELFKAFEDNLTEFLEAIKQEERIAEICG